MSADVSTLCSICRTSESDPANDKRHCKTCAKCQKTIDHWVNKNWRKAPHPNTEQLNQKEPYEEENDGE